MTWVIGSPSVGVFEMAYNNIEKRIREWLTAQGYPLEMRVAREFQERGFRVFQSEYYKDPESGDYREADVVALLQTVIAGCITRVQFVVECKTSIDKPWVLFTSDLHIADPARVAQRAASTDGHRLLDTLATRDDVQLLSMFQVHKRSAYGFTQAFTSGADRAYGTATSASKAAAALASSANEYCEGTKERVFVLSLPVIVVSGVLTESYLEKGGEIAVNLLSSGTLMWRNPVVGMPHTIIPVVSEEAVAAFAADAFESAEKFLKIAESEIPELLELDQ